MLSLSLAGCLDGESCKNNILPRVLHVHLHMLHSGKMGGIPCFSITKWDQGDSSAVSTELSLCRGLQAVLLKADTFCSLSSSLHRYLPPSGAETAAPAWHDGGRGVELAGYLLFSCLNDSRT